MHLLQFNYKQKLSSFKRYITRFRIYLNPRFAGNKIYKRRMYETPQWDNPKTYIEKIYWMQLYSNTTQWTICSDKLKVREYIDSKKCGHLLNQLYGS
jgi:hypothetical protein